MYARARVNNHEIVSIIGNVISLGRKTAIFTISCMSHVENKRIVVHVCKTLQNTTFLCHFHLDLYLILLRVYSAISHIKYPEVKAITYHAADFKTIFSNNSVDEKIDNIKSDVETGIPL